MYVLNLNYVYYRYCAQCDFRFMVARVSLFRPIFTPIPRSPGQVCPGSFVKSPPDLCSRLDDETTLSHISGGMSNSSAV